MDVWIKSIGEKRGAPHLYFDGTQAVRAGFSPGQKFDVEMQDGKVVLSVNKDGSRTVSSKTVRGVEYPVIDINSKELLAMFEGMASVRVIVQKDKVYLLPLASEIKKKERIDRVRNKMISGEPMAMGSISHGGGVLSSAIHEGLKSAGIDAGLAFANEIREDLLLQSIENNHVWDDAKTSKQSNMALCIPMQELAQDDWLLSKLPMLDCLEMGLPCSGASKAGASKRGLSKMEDHPDVGHLVHSALAILNKVQPVVVLLENVPEYANSASAMILRHQLRDMGYNTHEAILEGRDFGCIENRVRWCLVGTTQGLDFNMDNLAPTVTMVHKLSDYLDKDIKADDPRYREVAYLKEKEVRDAAKGNSFAMQVISEDSTSVPTLRKGYQKGGSTDPRLIHPTDSTKSRLLTASEHAKIKGVPSKLIHGLSESNAHQLLGQGIVYAPFEVVGKRIGESLQKLAAQSKKEVQDVAVKRPLKKAGSSFGIG